MRIIVLAKEVPDTYGERRLDLETGLADRTAGSTVLDEIGERAVEAAVTLAEQRTDTEVTVLSMGPATASTALRKALAMGASSAVHVTDDRLRGADLTLTAEVLAAAISRTGFDLVIAGNLSTDGAGGVLPAMIAEHLKVPHASGLGTLELDDGEIRGIRSTDEGIAAVTAPLPAVVSISERMPEPRFPNFKGIMAAKKKPLETVTLDDLGLDAEEVVPRSIMTSIAERPARAAGVTITDDGEAAAKLAEFLLANKLA